MRKRKPVPEQLTLFDTSQYELARSHYDIEDGEDEEDCPPLPVTESTWPPSIESESVTESPYLESESVTESTEGSQPTVDSVTFPHPQIDSVTSPVTESNQGRSRQLSVAPYCPGGTARSGEYFRYSYKANAGKTRHVHIPGGNTSNPKAVSRAVQIIEASERGTPHTQILEMIRSWTKKSR